MKILAWLLAAPPLLIAARADAAAWWIDTSDGCYARRADLQREVTLACGAVGETCRVVRRHEEAELVAHLACDGERWSLETRTIEGALLARIELTSEGDDRLREAAVEVARDAAPERTLVGEALRDAMPGGPAERPRRPPSIEPAKVVFALAPRASSMELVPMLFGASGSLGMRTVGALRATAAFSYLGGGSGVQSVRFAAGSAGLAYGAPYARSAIVGAHVEAGLRAREYYIRSGRGFVTNTDNDVLGGAGMYVQWPDAWIRPFAGASFALGYRVAGSADIGVAVDVL
jgi:hypothetical protein